MILEQSGLIVQEVKKAFMGKDDVIARVLTAIYAGGHVLLEDCPGVGENDAGTGLFEGFGAGFQENPVYHGHSAVRYHRFYDVQPSDRQI